jgi:hypothetical protein
MTALENQIYRYDNPLLEEPLKLSHVKPAAFRHGVSDQRASHIRTSYYLDLAKENVQ